MLGDTARESRVPRCVPLLSRQNKDIDYRKENCHKYRNENCYKYGRSHFTLL